MRNAQRGKGLISRIFSRKQEEDDTHDLIRGFAENGADFELRNLKNIVQSQKNLKELRAASIDFRRFIADNDIENASKSLSVFIKMHEGKMEDTRPAKMMRALFMQIDDPVEHKDLIFSYLDKFTCDNPLGRNLCRAVVENNMLDEFEQYVQTQHSKEEISARAKFYSELEKNFIKHISS